MKQLAFPGFTPLKGGDRGVRYIIYTRTATRPGQAPSVREIASACMVDEQRVADAVARLVANSMVVEAAGVLYATGLEPFGGRW